MNALNLLHGKSLIAWSAGRLPPDDALWREAYHRQLTFVRHDLPRAWRAAPPAEVHDTILVVGEHLERRIELPVYQVDLPTVGVVALLRSDFHRWTVAISATRPVRVATSGLFDPSIGAPPWSRVGMPAAWHFGAYNLDHARFTAVVATDLQLYALMHMVARRTVEGPLAGLAEGSVELEPDEHRF